ncbi:MAG: TetR/AcrR family transcriptional regulator [Caulobacterales bacterium]|nr:TetR/AcrR family transcriptional regulator [Caulobacterales bacterium]
MTAAAPTVRKKPRVDQAARRDEYVRTAARVFLEKGLHAATMRDIAEAAGAAKVLFYRLFPSREALVDAVFERVAGAIDEAFDQPWEGYGSMVGKVLETARKDPAPFLVVFRNCRASMPEWESRLRRVLARTSLPLFEPGPNAPAGAEARSRKAAGALFGLFLDSMVTWLEDRDGLTDEERIRWWGRIVRENRAAGREAFRLD